jgi:hypothetical protein
LSAAAAAAWRGVQQTLLQTSHTRTWRLRTWCVGIGFEMRGGCCGCVAGGVAAGSWRWRGSSCSTTHEHLQQLSANRLA